MESHGSKPSPRRCHAITKTRTIIWVYGGHDKNGSFDDLYEFNLCLLAWTQIQTVGSLSPKKRWAHSLTAISDQQILLYGGSSNIASWIFDLPSLSWRQHSIPTTLDGKVVEMCGRSCHTGVIGIQNVIIFGGCYNRITTKCTDILCIMFEPKSLLKSCLEVVYRQRSCLLKEWGILPRNIQAMLRAMCELSGNDGDANDVNCDGINGEGNGIDGDAADVDH